MSELTYYDEDGNATSLYKLVRNEPSWAESRIRHMDKEIVELKSTIERQQEALDAVREVQTHHPDNCREDDVLLADEVYKALAKSDGGES